MKKTKIVSSLIIITAIVVGAWLFYFSSETNLDTVSKERIILSDNNLVNISEKKEAVKNLINGGKEDDIKLSDQLKSRVKAQEFIALNAQDVTIDLNVARVNEWSIYTSIIFDAVLQRDEKYQWVQLKTLWDKERLMDIQLQPIDYYERVKVTPDSREESISFVNQVVKNLNHMDVGNFGWRYQQQNPMISKSVKSIEILESKVVAANNHGEILIDLKYKITLMDQEQLVNALFFVKKYGNKNQIEDIQIIDVSKIGD